MTAVKYKRISATITEEDYAWLKQHPEINISGLLQSCIRNIREKIQK
jgi:hypothetical protein